MGCQPSTYSRDQVFIASDLNLYYDPNNSQWHKRPDWFVVAGVPRLYDHKELRLSYVSWQEGVRPLVVVELLSPSTRNEDLGKTTQQPDSPPTKWQVYERILGVPYYQIVRPLHRRVKSLSIGRKSIPRISPSRAENLGAGVEFGVGLVVGGLRWHSPVVDALVRP